MIAPAKDTFLIRGFAPSSMAVVLSLGCLNCASSPFPKPQVEVRLFGDVDLQRNRELAKSVKDAIDAAPEAGVKGDEGSDVQTVAQQFEIRVLDGSVPEGISLTEGGSQIEVHPDFQDRYAVIGSAQSKIVWPDGYFFQNVYWTTGDYEEGWRKALCWPQAPLKLLSMGIWNIVPLSWPCWMSPESRDADQRTEMMISSLKIATHEMGGNLLLITSHGRTRHTLFSGSTGQVLNSTEIPATSMKGYVIRVDPKAKEENEADAPSI